MKLNYFFEKKIISNISLAPLSLDHEGRHKAANRAAEVLQRDLAVFLEENESQIWVFRDPQTIGFPH